MDSSRQRRVELWVIAMGMVLGIVIISFAYDTWNDSHPFAFAQWRTCKVVTEIKYGDTTVSRTPEDHKFLKDRKTNLRREIQVIAEDHTEEPGYAIDGGLRLPDGSLNIFVYDLVGTVHGDDLVKDCDGGIPIVATAQMYASTKSDIPVDLGARYAPSWFPVMVTEIGNTSIFRTEHDQTEDYIEIALSRDEVAHVLTRDLSFRDSFSYDLVNSFVTSIARPGEVRGDAGNMAVRFRWSTSTAKIDVLKVLARVLQIKWEVNATSKHQGAIFVTTAEQKEFSSGEVLTDGNSPLKVRGLDAATNESPVVTGALYWQ